jgi:hypothetical protein
MSNIYGIGPWYVFYVFEPNKKYDQLYIHTYPDVIVSILNNISQSRSKWILICNVGFFDVLEDAKIFYNLWNKNKQFKTKFDNIEKLFKKYQKLKENNNVKLWKIQDIPEFLNHFPNINKCSKVTVFDIKADNNNK